MFDYKEENLTGFEVITSISKEGYSVRDVLFESPFKRKVSAYLFMPDLPGMLPAVIFMSTGQGNRDTFFIEAEMLAAKGFVSLLIDDSFLGMNYQQEILRNHNFVKSIEALADIQNYLQTVIEIRRGVTLLCKLECVDKTRIAYVGHSFGATWGGVLAGIENRIKTFILMAGYGKFSEWHMSSEHPTAALIRTFLPPERYEYFISNLRKMDAINYIKNASPASVFFQFAEKDEYIDQAQALGYFSAASFPKKISWYNADHRLTKSDNALKDRQEWIFTQIGRKNDKLLPDSKNM